MDTSFIFASFRVCLCHSQISTYRTNDLVNLDPIWMLKEEQTDVYGRPNQTEKKNFDEFCLEVYTPERGNERRRSLSSARSGCCCSCLSLSLYIFLKERNRKCVDTGTVFLSFVITGVIIQSATSEWVQEERGFIQENMIRLSSSVISTSYWHSKDYSSAGFLVKCYSHRRTITDVTINLDIHMETNSNSWALKRERNKQDYIVVPCITAEQGGNVGHLNGNVLRKSYIGRGWCYYWSSRGRLVQTAGPQCAVLIYGAPSNNLR